MAQIVNSNLQNLHRVAEFLRQGELVAIPTETVYGLAGNAFSEESLAKIFSTKERPKFDPLIVHVPKALGNIQALWQSGVINGDLLSEKAYAVIQDLMDAHWPGPLTLVLPKGPKISDLATSGLPSVAVRMPAHSVTLELLSLLDFPLAAPSANRFGKMSPTTPEAVNKELGDRISLILDGGPCAVGVESTVVQIHPETAEIALLRPGKITQTEIESLTRQKIRAPRSPSTPTGAQVSPGQLESHYAPDKRLYILSAPIQSQTLELLRSEIQSLGAFSHMGLLTFSSPSQPNISEILGKKPELHIDLGSDMTQAARKLFQSLRELDESSAEILLTEPVPTLSGLGHAISDRLTRASYKRS